MIPKGLFTQIIMVVVAVAIAFTYVQPTLNEIIQIKSDQETYETKRQEVAAVNAKLAAFVDQVRSVPSGSHTQLRTYMPDQVDDINVQRDLVLISTKAGVLYRDVQYSDAGSQDSRSRRSSTPVVETLSTPKQFQLEVEGTYEQLKDLFALLEQNHYPLEVHRFEIASNEGGFLSASINLVTYEYQPNSD